MKLPPSESTPQSHDDTQTDVSPVASINRIRERVGAFVKSIPPALARREDNLPTTVAAMNASPRSKLRAINNVLDSFGEATAPFVACKRGCSSCCHMNITISQVEANEIARKSMRACQTLEQHVSHDFGEFSGVPCPFLIDDACSIYGDRPYVCRKHYSFDTTPHWCHPERSTQIKAQLIHFNGAQRAYEGVVAKIRGNVMADIRDFFPIGERV